MRERPAILITIALFLGGCSVFTPVTTAGPAPTPVVAVSTIVPRVTPTSSSSSPDSSGPVDAAGFAAATCTANSEFSLGYGNPDAGTYSVAWQALLSAVTAKDPQQIDTAAAAVLVHLDAAQVATTRGSTWPTGAPANAELLIVLSGLETYVRTVQTARGDATVSAQAATAMEAVWPHLQAYLGLLEQLIVAKTIPLTQLPC